MQLNKSGLRPLGRAVLVKPYEPEVKEGLIKLPDQVKERMSMIEQRAVVLDVGPEAWVKEAKPRASIGDHVLISRYAGIMAVGPLDGQQYRLCNDNDLFCQIEEAV